MTPVSNNNFDHQTPRTGNLEELFRQKFAEAELTPRADVWDRLDHELLLRENQGYRRRLVNYRRLAAAACAVATLGTGAWLTTQRQPGSASTATVAATTPGAFRLEKSGAPRDLAAAPTAVVTPAAPSALGSQPAAEAATASASQATAPALNARVRTAPAAAGRPGHELASAAPHTAQASLGSQALAAIKESFGESGAGQLQTAGAQTAAPLSGRPVGEATLAEAGSNLAPTHGTEAASADTWAALALQPVDARLLLNQLGSALPDSLKRALPGGPALLAATAPQAEQDQSAADAPSHWRWRGGYSAQRFAPNVSSLAGSGIALSRGGTQSYNTPRPTNMAPRPTEPTQLQAGLAHRGHVGAAVPIINSHWTLLTGAELAVISGRTGTEVEKDANNPSPNYLADDKARRGSYRFTTVSLPVQLRYEGRKQGWGVYAAMGAAVNVLLRNRTETGSQTATDDAAYRRVLGAVRGSAGIRYAAAGGRWQLNLGPEGELSTSTLNANPVESWAKRTRPYTLGLAASMEFSTGKPEPGH